MAFLKVVLPDAIHLVTTVLHLLLGTFKFVSDLIVAIVTVFVDLLTGNWSKLGRDLQDITIKLGNDLKHLFGDLFDAIGTIVHGVLGGILAFIGGFVQGVVGFFQWLFNQLVGHSIIPDLINLIFAYFNFLANLPGMVFGFLNGVVQHFRDLPGWIMGALGNLGNLLFGAGMNLILGLVRGIQYVGIPLPHFSINASNVGEMAQKILAGQLSFGVNWYGEGGIATRPQIAGIGDVPEAIIPLSRMSELMGGGGRMANIIVELDSRVLAEAMGEPLVDLIRLKTGVR